MTEFRGFKGIEAVRDNPIGGAHSKVLAWYAGTVDQALKRIDNEFVYERDGIEIQDRKGEVNVENWYDRELDPSAPLWYSSSTIPDEYDPEEGIGTGWYYSYLNGGERKFDNPARSTVTTAFDNTSDPRSRGDFAVPTLFNGNFDASFSGNSESVTNNGVRNFWQAAIPGWSYHNGRPDQFDREGTSVKYGIDIENLVDWKKISTLSEDYRQQVGYSKTQPNFALKMDGGDSIVHNRFVVPDWGSLRFDLHTPGLDKIIVPREFPKLRAFLTDEESGQEYELSSRVIVKGTSRNSPRFAERDTGVEIVYRDIPTIPNFRSNRIAYGVEGFETFNLDVPDRLRGKLATLRFELDSTNSPVYLENVFFQSQHLLTGNPTDSKILFDPTLSEEVNDDRNSVNKNNYLIEKPQLSIAYSETDNNPLWASWQLNNTWLGNLPREGFESDLRLPHDWYKVKKEDYSNSTNFNLAELQIPGTIDPGDGQPFELQPGHVVPAADRDRNRKDSYEVNLLNNVLPQHQKLNFPVWEGLEAFSRDLVEDRNRELYILAGGYGTKSGKESVKGYNSAEEINVPDNFWKVVTVFDEPGQGIADITEDTKVIAVVSPNDEPPLTGGTNPKYKRWYEGGMEIISVRELENRLNADSSNQARGITYDFLSNVPKEIQDAIETQPFTWSGDNPINAFPILNASLLANMNTNLAVTDAAIGHNSIPKTDSTQTTPFEIGVSQISFLQETSPQISSTEINIGQISSIETSVEKSRIPQISIGQISNVNTGIAQIGSSKVGTSKVGTVKTGLSQFGITEIYSLQDGTFEVEFFHPISTQVSTTEVDSIQHPFQFSSREVSFPSSIPLDQFLSINSSHNSTPEITNVLNDTATNIWSDLLQTKTQLDIDFQITDLPKEQLAEATITGFDENGVPNAGTIEIDHDANGVGWFIDPTPLDNSEFTAQDTDSYLLATAESEAEGKYDLLTTVLHELAHLYGFIDGYEGFDANIETENGTTKFVGNDFEAILNGEHLDKSAHPYDLLNTHLAPGMRKLPSELDVEILQALVATELDRNGSNPVGEELLASLTSDPLLAIANGDFSISDTTTDSFAWDTRGASGIESGQAVLTEDSPFLSNFTQTFTVPEEAKTIQFKLIGAELGASELAPPDAFEVALLDTDTNESLTAVSDLSNTDSLLNIQNDGTAYFSDKVRIGGASSGEIIGLDRPRTVTVDISDLTPGTEATLYFDLLGFGDADSRVVIDDVRLSDQFLLPPVANDDIATVTQGNTVAIDILANDTDDDGTLDLDSVEIQTEPANGTAIVNNDGTVSYTPSDAFVGEDSFTYTVQDNDEQQSETASVNVTVENAIPKISEVQIPDTVTEGVEVRIGAIALDAGNDELTYSWTIDGEALTENNPQINYTFPDNGTYTGSVTVTDTHGGSDTQTFEVTVENAVPVVDAGSFVCWSTLIDKLNI